MVYRTAISLDDREPRWHYRLGRVLERQERWAEARRAYEVAVRGADAEPAWYYRLGVTRERSGDPAAAIDAYRTALEADASDAEWHYRLARAYQKVGDLGAASASYQAFIDRNGTRGSAHYRLGQVHTELGNHEAAAHAFHAATFRDADRAEWHWSLGRARHRAGDLHGAVASYRAALAIDDCDARRFQRLAAVLDTLRDWSAAAEAYQQAIERDGTHEAWHHRLAVMRDRSEMYGPPTHQKPTYVEGALDLLRAQLGQRRVHLVGVGAGYVPETDDDPLLRLLLDLRDSERDRVSALLIEPQPDRVEGLQELFRGRRDVTILAEAVSTGVPSLQLHRITDEASAELRAAHASNDGRRYTSADRQLVVTRLVQKFGFSADDAEARVEAFDVPARDLSLILDEAGFPRDLDLLQVDIQGMDAAVVQTIDMSRFRPRILSYEIAHLPDTERQVLRGFLERHGYRCRRVNKLDEIATLLGEEPV
jgi:FkbM family methyltransferase